MSNNKYVIVQGNLSDGFQIIGPFDSFDDAMEYEQDAQISDTWIMELFPIENENE